MKVLVTGSNGFIGKNLQVKLTEKKIEFDVFTRQNNFIDLEQKLLRCNFVVHLAGINRPEDEREFEKGNTELTKSISDIVHKNNLSIPIIYTSSIQAELDNAYGVSKKKSENALIELSKLNGNKVLIYRLPNVFGKWCKPNYNSVVATFCNNIANDLPIVINDPNSIIDLVYIDDLIDEFLGPINNIETCSTKIFTDISPIYQITVGNLVEQLNRFKSARHNSTVERVGSGLTRALYSTYISYYKPSNFIYPIEKHKDPRGIFVEMLKTKDSGQFSFFTAHTGVTRGGHYHHSKNEKFLVIKGTAKFRFKHIITGEFYEIETNGSEPEVVETVPGWSHDITNIGDDELVVMLWANEIFNTQLPDTINYQI